jgi:hypothetical protein
MSSNQNDAGEHCPACHLVFSSDTDHYVGGVDSSFGESEAPHNEPDGDEGNSATNESPDPVITTPSTDNIDLGKDDDNDVQPTPVDADSSNGVVVSPEPNADIASVVDQPIPTTIAPAMDVVKDDEKPELAEGCNNDDPVEEECKKDDDKEEKHQSLDESVYVEIPHQMENLDEAVQSIAHALTRKYGGHITHHDGHSLTHVRKDGLVDRVKASHRMFKIRTHKLYSADK